MSSGKTSKRLRQELMANQQRIQEQKYELIQGPLPDPQMLSNYKNADPSFPERIMRMAEEHNAADVSTKNRISLSNLIVPIIGQIFTLVLGAGSILACKAKTCSFPIFPRLLPGSAVSRGLAYRLAILLYLLSSLLQ
jgi:uncharacterized membrane protein